MQTVMSMKINRFFLAASVALLFSSVLSAQDGAFSSYSPYSVFGVGNMSRQGNAYTLSMGGVGLASRSNRFVNIVNPAAVTARDTLSFMLDFGLTLDNRVYRQGDVKSANNIFNLSNFVFSVPDEMEVSNELPRTGESSGVSMRGSERE